mmetsp:Transcript_16263/g.65704  ORF Transcript_16263/g.65704 Transcript_16263/m.65704 type:complete len:243 (-) Transcript_16263:311-1039(-)
MPRSTREASSCARHMPARSPHAICLTGFRNICIDLIFFSTPSCGSSTTVLVLARPRRHVPVTTVPWPRMEKQWSMAKKKGPSTSRRGILAVVVMSDTTSLRPQCSGPLLLLSVGAAPLLVLSPSRETTAATFSPPTTAAARATGASLNLDVASCARIFFSVLASRSSRSASGSASILLSTITRSSVVISPMTKHSAVCVWMPLTQSTTRTIMSIICAPPMIVRISDACPGQSTSVNCSSSVA